MKIRRENLLLYFLEQEGLDNVNDFFKKERIGFTVLKKMENSNNEYKKLINLYNDLTYIHHNGSSYNKYACILKEINKLNPYDVYVKKEIIFNDIDFSKDYKDKKYLTKENEKDLLNIIINKQINDESLTDEEEIFYEETLSRANNINKHIDEFKKYSESIFNECLNDSRMFEGKELKKPLSDYYIGRMYLESLILIYNLNLSLSLGEINSSNYKTFEDIILKIMKYQLSNPYYEVRFEYLNILEKVKDYSKFNKVLDTFGDKSLTHYVYSNYDNLIHDLDKKESIKKLSSVNPYFLDSLLIAIFSYDPEDECFSLAFKTEFTRVINDKGLRDSVVASKFLINKLLEDFHPFGKEFINALPNNFDEAFLTYGDENTLKMIKHLKEVYSDNHFIFQLDRIEKVFKTLKVSEIKQSLSNLVSYKFLVDIGDGSYCFSKEYQEILAAFEENQKYCNSSNVSNCYELIKYYIKDLANKYNMIEKTSNKESADLFMKIKDLDEFKKMTLNNDVEEFEDDSNEDDLEGIDPSSIA